MPFSLKSNRLLIGLFFFLFMVSLALYARTLMPGVGGGDIGEIQFLSYRLGLAHSTGYPLQLLLGRLWIAILPFGSVAWRINLLSAVFGSAAVAVTGLLAGRLTNNVLAGLVAGLMLALGRLFWELSVDGDKYALNGLFVALVLWLAWSWAQRPSLRRLCLLAAVYGLSLTHHRSMLVLAPLLAAFVTYGQPGLWRRPRHLGLVVLAGTLPLLLYLYLPWAEAKGLPPGTWHPRGLLGWIAWLADVGWTGQVYLSRLTLLQIKDFSIPAQFGELGWGGLLLALVGAVAAFRRHRAFAALLVAAYGLWVIMSGSFNIYDQDPRQWVQFMPFFVIAGLWCGVGAGALADSAAWLLRNTRAARLAGPLLLALLLMVPVARGVRLYPVMRALSHDTARLDPWRQVLKHGAQGQRLGGLSLRRLAPDPIVVSDWEQATILWYFQQVEGYRPDMTVMYPMERLQEAEATGRPVYLARALPGIGHHHHLTMFGPLIALLPTADTQVPADVAAADIVYSNTLMLAGYRYDSAIPLYGGTLPLTVYWRALRQPPADYAIGLRLVNSADQELWREDNQHPVLGSYPTRLWEPGQVVGDYYEVPLDRTLPAGRYHLAIIVYTHNPDGSFTDLRVGSADRGVLPAFDINK